MNFNGFNYRTALFTIENNIDASFDVKMYSEISFRLIKGDFSLHSDSKKRLCQLYYIINLIGHILTLQLGAYCRGHR